MIFNKKRKRPLRCLLQDQQSKLTHTHHTFSIVELEITGFPVIFLFFFYYYYYYYYYQYISQSPHSLYITHPITNVFLFYLPLDKLLLGTHFHFIEILLSRRFKLKGHVTSLVFRFLFIKTSNTNIFMHLSESVKASQYIWILTKE